MTAIELSTEGAKESRSVIKQFHSCLNSSDVVPEQAYRRNSGCYPLVCYINNVVGLFLSKNYEAIPVFVVRAVEHMATFPPSAATSAYYELANRYLLQMVYHLRHFVGGIEHWDDRIPGSFLEAGPQQVQFPSRIASINCGLTRRFRGHPRSGASRCPPACSLRSPLS